MKRYSVSTTKSNFILHTRGLASYVTPVLQVETDFDLSLGGRPWNSDRTIPQLCHAYARVDEEAKWSVSLSRSCTVVPYDVRKGITAGECLVIFECGCVVAN